MSTERYLNKPAHVHTIEQEKYLNDLDRGEYDCRKGHFFFFKQKTAYEIAYGARYVYEQMQSPEEFN